MTRHAVLVGLMGSGKSTVGRVMADRSGRPLLDSDELLERRAGGSAAEIARTRGMAELHRLEREILHEALRSTRSAVVTAAASIADDPATLDALAPHYVVWVTADLDTLVERVQDPEHRPLVHHHAEHTLREQAERRNERYETSADLKIDTGLLSPEQAATTALRHEAPPAARR